MLRKLKGGPANGDEQRYLIDVLSTLSPDFLQIEERAQRVADEAAREKVLQATQWTTGAAVFITILLAVIALLFDSNLGQVEADYTKLKASNAALEQRVEILEAQLSSARQTQGITRQSSVTDEPRRVEQRRGL